MSKKIVANKNNIVNFPSKLSSIEKEIENNCAAEPQI